ncbi:LamG domain-containing protein [Paenibacillus koleovorans]|uniref:LamG domain-containing protein n=1 Tax=Paenibacillus koleovorans TaxID=121608 RepID=UPI0013E311F2|nr:LamG domain-containing protein [Paenibacillus koleovorans]
MSGIRYPNRNTAYLFLFIVLLIGLFCWGLPGTVHANNTTYYVNNASGSNCNDAGAGTSSSAPWCGFTPVNAMTFQPGDQLLLARGAVWDELMELRGSGTSGSWITLDAYGSGSKPKIERSHHMDDRTLHMFDTSYWKVNNLEIANAGDGIRVKYTTLGNEGLYFDNLYIHDIDLVANRSPLAFDSIYYSTGIHIIGSSAPFPSPSQWVLRDIRITNSEIGYTTAPITLESQQKSSNEMSPNAFVDVALLNLNIHHAKGPLSLMNITNGRLIDSVFDSLGTVYLPQGTTGIFQWKTENFTYANNTFNHVPNTGSSDETMIDLEGYTNNTQFYSNYLSNTDGPGIEFLQLGSGNPPRNPALDHNTNNTLTGNVFVSNNYALKTISTSSVPTGTLTDNFYYEPGTGLTTGTFTGFTQTNNRSVASSNDLFNAAKQFGTTQGTNGWSYQLYNGSSYSNLSYDAANGWWGTSGGYVTRFNTFPNATSSNWLARAWTAPDQGTISIRGRVLKNDVGGGDGVLARITKNGTVIWPTGGTPQTIAYNDASGYNTNLDTISVGSGDVIRFEINNGGSGGIVSDATSWMPSIVYTSRISSTSGLMLHWKMNESSGTTAADASGNGYTGTVANGALWASGVVGNAISLDGTNDYVSRADSSSQPLDGMSAMTLSAWVNFAQLPPTGKYAVVAGKDISGASYRLTVNASGSLTFAVATVNNGWYTTGTTATASTRLAANAWYLVSGSYDGTVVRIYVNGKLDGTGSSAISGAIFNSASDFHVGRSSAANIDYLNGKVDEVRLYNRALLESELLQLYRNEGGVVGEWNLNETSGTVAADKAVAGNNGALIGGPSWTAGKSGNAIQLDGVNNYVTIADQAALDGMAALTISAWVHLSQMPVTGKYFVPVGKDSAGSSESYRLAISPGGSASLAVKTANNGWYTAGTTASSPAVIGTGTWVHLVGTYDGTTVKIYLNGSLAGTGASAISGVIYNGTSPLRFGYGSSFNIAYTNGTVDEVRIYNRALNATEVLALYASY